MSSIHSTMFSVRCFYCLAGVVIAKQKRIKTKGEREIEKYDVKMCVLYTMFTTDVDNLTI